MTSLSLAKNKQLQDVDFEIAFKLGLKNLTSLDCSYNNLTGQSFKCLNCDKLEKINVNCCSKLKNDGMIILLIKCNNNLRHLDISVTKINDEFFSSVPKSHLNGLKYLYIDFCTSVTLLSLQETLCQICPCLTYLSIFGISTDDSPGKLKVFSTLNDIFIKIYAFFE